MGIMGHFEYIWQSMSFYALGMIINETRARVCVCVRVYSEVVSCYMLEYSASTSPSDTFEFADLIRMKHDEPTAAFHWVVRHIGTIVRETTQFAILCNVVRGHICRSNEQLQFYTKCESFCIYCIWHKTIGCAAKSKMTRKWLYYSRQRQLKRLFASWLSWMEPRWVPCSLYGSQTETDEHAANDKNRIKLIAYLPNANGRLSKCERCLQRVYGCLRPIGMITKSRTVFDFNCEHTQAQQRQVACIKKVNIRVCVYYLQLCTQLQLSISRTGYTVFGQTPRALFGKWLIDGGLRHARQPHELWISWLTCFRKVSAIIIVIFIREQTFLVDRTHIAANSFFSWWFNER